MPDIVIKLQKTLSDENVSNDVVVRVVGSEPMLAGKLMNMANSAALNSSGRKIADLRQAVARVGFNIVRSAALAFAVEQLRRSPEFKHLEGPLDALVEEQRADRGAVARDRAALLLAQWRYRVAGRSHAQRRPHLHPDTRQQTSTLIADPLTFNSIVRDWHTNVSKALLENWRVAEEIVEAVAGHEDMDREQRGPVTLTDVLSLAIAGREEPRWHGAERAR